MPISLPPLNSPAKATAPSRRRFLVGSLAAAAGLVLGRNLPVLGEPSPTAAPTSGPAVDPDHFALLSDTHIAGNPKQVLHGVNMYDNLQRVSAEVIERHPSTVIIDGDLAMLQGKPEDYATFVESLKPMREAGLPIHLTLGNHDVREHFWSAFPDEQTARADHAMRPVDGRQAMVLPMPRANWFILDSLEKTNATPGLIGDAQIKWLAGALDAAKDKPALVMVHHNPQAPISLPTGLRDTAALMNTIIPRRNVKALFFGHTHDWHIAQESGLHLVNFPPTAYVFAPGKPNGWVEATLADGAITLQLHCLDKRHKQSGEKVSLDWRV